MFILQVNIGRNDACKYHKFVNRLILINLSIYKNVIIAAGGDFFSMFANVKWSAVKITNLILLPYTTRPSNALSRRIFLSAGNQRFIKEHC